MGRPGAGGGRSGGMSSGGGHRVSSHSGGGHRPSFGGSSRPGSRGSFSESSHSSNSGGVRQTGSFYGSSRRPFISPVIIGSIGSGRRPVIANGGCTGCMTIVVAVFVVIIIVSIFSGLFSGSSSNEQYEVNVPASSYSREKLSGTIFENDCVKDETGLISDGGSISGLERQLKTFYDITGIQPYVYLVGYRPELANYSEKQEFTSDFYDSEIQNNYTFAFFYFEDANPDEVGYMCYEAGSQALTIMDAEAVDIFWAITDAEWYSDSSTEDCIANMFNKTAKRIMTKTTTKKDIAKIVLIIVLVIVVAIVIIIIMNKRRKQEQERNEETRRILETPLE